MHNFYLMAFCLMLSSLTISAQNEVRKENFQLVHDEVVNSPSTVPDSRKYPPESDPYAGVTKNGVYAVELLVLHSTCRTWVLPFTTSR